MLQAFKQHSILLVCRNRMDSDQLREDSCRYAAALYSKSTVGETTTKHLLLVQNDKTQQKPADEQATTTNWAVVEQPNRENNLLLLSNSFDPKMGAKNRAKNKSLLKTIRYIPYKS